MPALTRRTLTLLIFCVLSLHNAAPSLAVDVPELKGRVNDYADLVGRGIKQGRRCQAVCDGIERIGTILAEHFPLRADDKNELHNLIIR